MLTVFINNHFLLSVAILVGGLLLIAGLLCWVIINSRRNRQKYLNLLYRDTLTGFDNYKKFLDTAPLLIKKNKDKKFALIYIDMVKFKYINDTFGYIEGDSILIEISNLISETFAKTGIFTRVYADHFAIITEYAYESSLNLKLDYFAEKLAKLSDRHEKKYNLIASCGIYLINNDEINIERAIDRANYARETIDDLSKTRYVYYDDNMRSDIIKAKEMEKKMRPALQNKEFVPYFQPKVDIATGKIIGAEALVRWKDPNLGILTPNEFIPFFEKNGFVVNIDLYMFEEVCKTIKRWKDLKIPMVPISCNFSRLHLDDATFSQKLRIIIDKYDIPPNMVELEMTESIALKDVQKAVTLTEELKKFGFMTAVDDFGAGYSSMGLLQKLPLDVIKLDKDFLLNGQYGGLEFDLVETLVKTLQKHDIDIVYEGVESRKQLNYIKQIQGRCVQGFIYSRPLALEIFEELLKTKATLTPKEV